ncbi:MAG TPA: G5 domain-containing protein, partial [Miltoncostaea sp.]|nr:G5 domain-containing protein [Miltoncostaea sp.]
REVETETGDPTDVKQPETRETKNPELPPGTREVKQELGGPGFTISYTRRVLVNGDVKRDETFHWTYDPQDAFIEVGPEKARTTTAPDRGGTTTAPGRTTTTAPRTPEAPPTRTQTQPQAPSPGGSAPPPPG